MKKKISVLPLAMYLAFIRCAKSLKNDERGLSGVVVAILLILIAVLAVVLIWGFLGDWLAELWETITGKTAGLS